MRYYISDLHFYHDNLNTRMDMRGFADADAMNRHIIAKWNEKVRENDEVIILGDLSVAGGVLTNEILKEIRGKLYLIRGNHDKFLKDKRFDPTRFIWIEDYKELNDNKRRVVLSHYPIFCYNGQYRLDKDGHPKVYMLYGHVHDTYDEYLVDKFIKESRTHERTLRTGSDNKYPIPCQMINCFCMFSDYTPLSLDEWIINDKMRRAHTGKSL